MVMPLLYFATGLLGVGLSYRQSKKDSSEAKYNAALKLQEARNIEGQKAISRAQWDREIGSAIGTFVNRAAGAGLTMSGSPMNALIDMTTQLTFDKAIEQYNLNQEQQGAFSQAAALHKQAKQARKIGHANAFASALSAGVGYQTWKRG